MKEGWPPAQQARVDILLKSLPNLAPEARRLLMYQLRFEADEGGASKAYLLPVFEHGLKDTEEEVRLNSIHAIPAIESKSSLDPLIAALEHPDASVRYYAACGLRDLSLHLAEVKSIALSGLRRSLERPQELDLDVPLAVAHALVSLGEKLDGTIFIQALHRQGANWALASDGLVMLGRKDAVLLLIRRLNSRTFDPRYIEEALEKLTGQALGIETERWMDWYRKNAAQLPPQVD